MSPRLKVILAATDFSAPATLALERAVQLSKAHGARLELVHTFDAAPVMPAWGDPGGGAWVGEKMFMDGVRDQLERTRAQLAAEHDVTVHATLEVGPAHRQIALHAQTSGAELVVIGASGKSGLLQRLLGSTAQNVVRSSLLPVLVVRTPAATAYSAVIAASDFSEDAMAAARLALNLAPGTALQLLHAFDSVYDNDLARDTMDAHELNVLRAQARARVAAQLEQERQALTTEYPASRVTSVLRDGGARECVEPFVSEAHADLLAIGAHGKTRWEAGLLGSTSQHAIAHAPCDVLVWKRAE